MSQKILIIEDDREIRELLKICFQKKGSYQAYFAEDGRTGLSLFSELRPGLVLLDLTLPDISGWDVLRTLRQDKNTAYTPVIIMTANYRETVNEVMALKDYGADDYLLKPFNIEVLLARVNAVFRRKKWENGTKENTSDGEKQLKCAGLKIDLAGHRVKSKSREVLLTKMEFNLLVYLVRNRNRLIRKKELLEEVWGHCEELETRTVDRHINTLRDKLGTVGNNILTVFGEGYKFSD